MSTKRVQQVGTAIHETLAGLFVRGAVSDPRVRGVTVLGVKVSPDLQLARVYFSCLGGSAQSAEVVSGLRSASGFLRKHLSEVLGLRYTPQLAFHFDETMEKAARIESLLTQIRQEDSATVNSISEAEHSL
jgi:ribosome-binding factor A